MKRIFVIALSILMALSAAALAGCGKEEKSSSSTSTTKPANYVEKTHYDNLEEAEEKTDIEVKIPEKIEFEGVSANYEAKDYFSDDSGALQITYKNGDDSIQIRKGKDEKSVNTYKSVENTSYHKDTLGVDVTYSGFNTTSSSEWVLNGEAYAIIISGADVRSIETVTEQVISLIK